MPQELIGQQQGEAIGTNIVACVGPGGLGLVYQYTALNVKDPSLTNLSLSRSVKEVSLKVSYRLVRC